MSASKNAAKDPLFHIVKRDKIPFWKATCIRLIGILLALIACALFIYGLTGFNPLDVYKTIIDGAIGTKTRTWTTLRDTAILLTVAIGLTPAFKMRFWNIGGEGQILCGAAASAALMIYCANIIPQGLLVPVMAIASLLAGALWGIIPAIFKAKWNTNETLFTLMLNYIATQLVTFFIIFWENPKGSNSVGTINSKGKIGWMPKLFNQNAGWIVLISLILVVIMFIYLRYTKHGYEIAVVGASENTARYAHINVSKVIIRTMAISGAVCGLAGFLLVSGSSHTISTSTSDGRGFTAIVVAWLSKLNVFVMVLFSFMLVFLDKGAVQITSKFKLNDNASDMMVGILLFFIIGFEFFINYKLEFQHRHNNLKGDLRG